jgi:hydroxymethylpyrimidine pyrophosphatase-like HAD family hydrolase
MSSYFHAVALDYDGTLADDEVVGEDVRAALRDARGEGRRLVLVTGRIIDELSRVFPEADELFDLVVAENGAVLHGSGVSRALVPPVLLALDRALVEAGIPFRRGQVLLACHASYELAVFEALRRLGSDCQLVRNRSELMVLPAGVTKGSGLATALEELGISQHSTLGVGDAENDLALLEECEIGVAVSNAVDSLKERADVVLARPGGQGVASLLRGPLLHGGMRVEPKRRRVQLGRARDGGGVELPASQVNVLVTGGSGAGKSYAAGLVAERLIERDYSVCIFDPEGDHAPLGRLRGVASVGGRAPLPVPEELAGLLRTRLHSLVVDLSLMPTQERQPYLVRALAALRHQRAETGLPHWIFIDEAHAALPGGSAACDAFDPESGGFCLVTFRPQEVCDRAQESFDFLLAVAGEKGLDEEALAALTGLASLGADAVAELRGMQLELGEAALARVGASPELRVFDLGPRWVRHVRHWHKYARAKLPVHLRFYMRGPQGATGAAAANLAELHRELVLCAPEVIDQHARGGDFSRWIRDVMRDDDLADALHDVERRSGAGAAPEELRTRLLRIIEARYLD